jgi:hypothetical protein
VVKVEYRGWKKLESEASEVYMDLERKEDYEEYTQLPWNSYWSKAFVNQLQHRLSLNQKLGIVFLLVVSRHPLSNDWGMNLRKETSLRVKKRGRRGRSEEGKMERSLVVKTLGNSLLVPSLLIHTIESVT